MTCFLRKKYTFGCFWSQVETPLPNMYLPAGLCSFSLLVLCCVYRNGPILTLGCPCNSFLGFCDFVFGTTLFRGKTCILVFFDTRLPIYLLPQCLLVIFSVLWWPVYRNQVFRRGVGALHTFSYFLTLCLEPVIFEEKDRFGSLLRHGYLYTSSPYLFLFSFVFFVASNVVCTGLGLKRRGVTR